MIELIKQAAMDAIKQSQPINVHLGTVTGINPLTIETDERLMLTEAFLALSRRVVDHQTWISIDDESKKQRIRIYDKPESEPVVLPTIPLPEEERVTDIQFLWTNYRINNNISSPDEQQNEKPGRQPTKLRITVYNHLMLGDRVLLLKQQGGQKYYVVDRLEPEDEDVKTWFRSVTST